MKTQKLVKKASTPANAGKKKHITKAGKKSKMEKIMEEWKHGNLKTNAGKVVEDQKQAIAIGLSESGQSYKDKKGK